MHLSVTGKSDYNGFILLEPLIHEGNLVVLTGRNGCGKTRVLESIKKRHSVVSISDNELKAEDIQLVEPESFTPNYNDTYDHNQFQRKITATLKYFDEIKSTLDHKINPNMTAQENERNRRAKMTDRNFELGLSYEGLHLLCKSISTYLNKLPSELTHEEIITHFEDETADILGIQNISGIFNQYIKRRNENDYNKYRSEQKGHSVNFFTEDQFTKRFGNEPWKLLNNIIQTTFNGKFYFSEPDTESLSYSYKANLFQHKTNRPVPINTLSSGEKTLLWLALTLFNSQYYNKVIVKVPKLLLLDEPDAFLHPKMVVQMYRVLNEFCSIFGSRIIITTHSPTTVALAPDKSTYVVKENAIIEVSKDEAVAELLDGITQISINSDNRRQVFVESHYDADFYQSIFNAVLRQSQSIDPYVSLTFVSSGPKIPEQQISDCLSSVLGINDVALVDEFIKAINGVGSCSHVYGTVKSLINEGNSTVRGIVDWDGKNKPKHGVSVLAEMKAYTIENLALDPICIAILLNANFSLTYSSKDICGSDTHWLKWLNNSELLQKATDWYIEKILDRPNQKDMTIEYLCGEMVLTDSDYLKRSGHDYEDIILEKLPQLKSLFNKSNKGGLKIAIAQKGMIGCTDGKLVPKYFEELFISLN